MCVYKNGVRSSIIIVTHPPSPCTQWSRLVVFLLVIAASLGTLWPEAVLSKLFSARRPFTNFSPQEARLRNVFPGDNNVLIFSPIFVASEQVYHCFSTYLLVKFALGDFIFY